MTTPTMDVLDVIRRRVGDPGVHVPALGAAGGDSTIADTAAVIFDSYCYLGVDATDALRGQRQVLKRRTPAQA